MTSSTTSQDQTEIEWQFDAASADAVAVWLEAARVPGYRIAAAGEKQLRDTYLDTEDWRMRRAKFTCRVRAKGDGHELTLKTTAAATDGLRQRREITEKIGSTGGESNATVAIRAPGPCGNALRLLCGANELRALFEIRTRRRIFMLHDESEPLAEIAVDETTVGASDTLRRIEVEALVEIERVQRFVDLFIVAAELQPASVSKFEFALKQANLAPPQYPPNLGPAVVRPGMTAAEAAFAIFRKQFGAVLANEGGTRLGEDIEGLHDMRVATRRMRAAMSAFSPWTPAAMERFRTEFGWVAAILGPVRDLDVQLERLHEWREQLPPGHEHSLDALENLLNARREKMRTLMLRGLDSKRYERLCERFARTLEAGPSRLFATGRTPMAEVAPLVVAKRYRQFRRLGDPITAASPADDWHTLRIAGKKLRYALEFVAPIYGERLLEFSQRVTALQDILGLHQDAYVAIDMLNEMAAKSARALSPENLMTMGAIAERYRVDAVRLRAAAPGAYKRLGQKPWLSVKKALAAGEAKA